MYYEAVIFDLDGTLINSLEDLADSCNEVMNAFGYPVHTIDKYKYFVGNGVRKLVERAMPEDKSADPEGLPATPSVRRAAYRWRSLGPRGCPYRGCWRRRCEPLRRVSCPG